MDDFDQQHLETMALIQNRRSQSTPVEQNFLESSGAMDVLTPDQVPVDPTNLRRSMLRSMRMGGPEAQRVARERGLPEITQEDLGGGTVAVPPQAPKVTGETLSFIKSVNEKPGKKGGKAPLGSGSSESDFRAYLSMANSNALKAMKFNQPDQFALMMAINKSPDNADIFMAQLERSMTPQQKKQHKALVDSFIRTNAPDDVVEAYAERTARPGAEPEMEEEADPNDPLGFFKGRK